VGLLPPGQALLMLMLMLMLMLLPHPTHPAKPPV
jgi:hypothetical protein